MKVLLFKQPVGQKLPLFWVAYLLNLVDNRKCFEEHGKMVVYTLLADNKELHRVIAQEVVLRKMIIKAAQFKLS